MVQEPFDEGEWERPERDAQVLRLLLLLLRVILSKFLVLTWVSPACQPRAGNCLSCLCSLPCASTSSCWLCKETELGTSSKLNQIQQQQEARSSPDWFGLGIAFASRRGWWGCRNKQQQREVKELLMWLRLF